MQPRRQRFWRCRINSRVIAFRAGQSCGVATVTMKQTLPGVSADVVDVDALASGMQQETNNKLLAGSARVVATAQAVAGRRRRLAQQASALVTYTFTVPAPAGETAAATAAAAQAAASSAGIDVMFMRTVLMRAMPSSLFALIDSVASGAASSTSASSSSTPDCAGWNPASVPLTVYHFLQSLTSSLLHYWPPQLQYPAPLQSPPLSQSQSPSLCHSRSPPPPPSRPQCLCQSQSQS
jgi:hypothetical protein